MESEITHSPRKDMFAAAALQGLLASGHFTIKNGSEGEPEAVRYETTIQLAADDKPKVYVGFNAVEIAWLIADEMIERETG